MTKKIERVPSVRALTRLLEEEGTKRITLPGQRMTGEALLARLVWQYVINGEVTLGNGSTLSATTREWITALKWVYGQIDGTPPKPQQDELEDGVITVEWVDPFDDKNDSNFGS